MNAEKAKRKPAKVKGAVLIMILAVMTVMIILLAGCIAVVYSTYNRVTVKYQENQAYYTMRSTLDVVYNDIMNSSELAPAGMDVYYYEGGLDPIRKLSGGSGTKLKRGRYEECALYKVPVNTETSGNNANQWYIDRLSSGAITSDDQVNILSTDFTAASTGITDTDLPNYAAQYGAKKWTTGMTLGVDDTVTYTVDMSTIANMAKDSSGNVVGKMLDADAGVNTATVKFQVLERMYDLGGSASDPIGKRFLLGDRKKDYFRVKATCEIDYDGEHCEYSVFYSTKEPDPKINGVSSLSRLNPGSKIKMVNEANSIENTTYRFDNNSVTTGDVSIFGDLRTSASGVEYVLQEGQVFFVKGTLDCKSDPESATGFKFVEDGGIVYCKNAALNKLMTSHSGSKGNLICSDTYVTSQTGCGQPASLFINNYVYNDNNPPSGTPSGTNWYNNIYICGNESNFIEVSGSTVKAKENLRKVLGNSTFSGRLYFGSLGPLGWSSVTVSDFNVTSSYCFNSSIASPGEAVYTFNSNTNLADPNDHTVTYDASKVLKLDYDTDAVLDTSTYKKKITLPGNLEGVGTNILEVKTQRYIFKDRFEDFGTDGTSTWDSDGYFDGILNPSQTPAQLKAFLWTHLKARDTLPGSTNANSPAMSYDPAAGGIPGISGGTVKIAKDPSQTVHAGTDFEYIPFDSVVTPSTGVLELKGRYSGKTLFNTTDGDITVVMKDNVQGEFYVCGDNTLKIYLDAGGGTMRLGDAKQFALLDLNTVNCGDGSINQLAGQPRGPRTTIYVPDDASGNPLVSQLIIGKMDSGCYNGIGPVITAQIDAPKTDLKFDSSGGKNYRITFGSYTTQNIQFTIMGSVFTNSFTNGEERGIWSMIPPDDPGDKSVNLVQRYR